jgi:hypothetical protein
VALAAISASTDAIADRASTAGRAAVNAEPAAGKAAVSAAMLLF